MTVKVGDKIHILKFGVWYNGIPIKSQLMLKPLIGKIITVEEVSIAGEPLITAKALDENYLDEKDGKTKIKPVYPQLIYLDISEYEVIE